MSSASMSFGRRTSQALPRGVNLLAAFTGALLALLRRIDRWQLGAVRAEPQTAEEVLAWAARIQHSEPGFAADLRAAALRSMN